MITEQETKLFNEWSSSRQGFSPDGIVDETKYLSSNPKIMLILKEVNNKKGESVDLKEFLRNGAYNRRPTWDNVARWVYGINNLDKEIEWKNLENRQILDTLRKELLPMICIINVKKSPGGHTSDNKKMLKTADQDKELLNRQFQLYYQSKTTRPDLIICGGSSTSNAFNAFVDIPNKDNWHRTTRGIWYYEYDTGRFFISYSHPEARVQDNLLYYGLIDAIKELKKQHAANIGYTEYCK
ncbi:hypothetical protein LA303_09010 [Candidatus Sulfidibacterium hydrothermale]|uniref:hypothetical protein n=1 Tax=Candidatus Sulfidibacterium hydrothermale TaxID=2875962 RepID=UPI001F0AB095|nr:hypothetical protein [Candidatus Sulfidibacterium hydrothermale]UBM61553.1 hypothetical protein LA303_09010 [Candidatus Sulfidibacterium hydrothermale]